jgi:hypothetical protein
MSLYAKLTILLLSASITFSCSKDDDSSVEDNYQNLNGTWSGQTRIIQAGDCPSTDPTWNPVEMEFDVDTNGTVQILVERQFSNLNMTWSIVGSQWIGRVKENDSIYLTKTQTIDCFGTDVIENTEFASKLLRSGGTIQLTLNTIEVFCAAQNCVFDRDYTLAIND